VRLFQDLPDLGFANLGFLDDQRARLFLVFGHDFQRLKLFTLKLLCQARVSKFQRCDSSHPQFQRLLELRVLFSQLRMQQLHRRGGFVPCVFKRSEFPHLLRGALQLRCLKDVDFGCQGGYFVPAYVRGGGFHGETHAEHAVLHPRLLGLCPFLVPVNAHFLQTNSRHVQVTRVLLHRGG